MRAAAAVEAARERGRSEIAAAEAALETARETARERTDAAVVQAGVEVAAALDVFTDEELARFTGVKVTHLRQWRRAARDAAASVADDGTATNTATDVVAEGAEFAETGQLTAEGAEHAL